jgi:RHS repeat-associated protein
MNWKLSNESATRGYSFSYDNLSRLTAAGYLENGSANNNYKTSYTYDSLGNVTALQRYGKTTATAYGLIDNLTITYSGNQLTKVEDAVANISLPESADFKNYNNATSEYAYSANGAMTKDLNKGISDIQYNVLNLPRQMDIKSPVAEARNEYTYSALGQKLKVVQKWNPSYSTTPVIGSAINTSSLSSSKTTDYVNNMIYEDGALKRILIDGGYIESGAYYYYVTDHQGNNRVVANASGAIVQKNHYYPFGMAFAETPIAEQGKQPYKYNSKELDMMNGLNQYDYSARYYDPAIARFTTIDPKAEKYYSISPYAYCGNNPVNRIDPNGMDDYRLNRETGDIEFYKKTKADTHTIYATKDNGKIDRKNSFSVDKYVLDGKETRSGVEGRRSDGSITKSDVDIYRSVGNDESTGMFEFLSKNSNVEWSQTKTTTSEGVELNYIATSHLEGSDVGQSMVISQVSSLYERTSLSNSVVGLPSVNITGANHSHPNGSTVVSLGDWNVATQLQSVFPNATMNNVTFQNKRAIYTKFSRDSEPGLLPGVIIRPR